VLAGLVRREPHQKAASIDRRGAGDCSAADATTITLLSLPCRPATFPWRACTGHLVNPVAALTDAERTAIGRLRGIYKVGGEEALEKALDELRKDSIKYVRVIAELSNEARK
jgi:hypothetical protein